MTISQIRQKYLPIIKKISPTPELDIQVIICHILKISSADFILHQDDGIPADTVELLESALERRSQHYPVSYIVGYKEFYGRIFAVTPDVLIPRPESEAIIDIIRNLPLDSQNPILDLGTGSGCLAITMAKELPQISIMASDISPNALRIAQKNAILHSVKINFILSDMLENIPDHIQGIVANLPYIDTKLPIDPSIQYEPSSALFSEDNGLKHYYHLFQQIQIKTHHPQWIIIEIDPNQLSQLIHLIDLFNLRIVSTHKDLQGHTRHILITKKN